MTSIQWQRVDQGKWKAVGTKARTYMPIPGLASLDIPEDVQILIKSCIPSTHPTSEMVDCFTDCVLGKSDYDDDGPIDFDVEHPVYKLFWANCFKKWHPLNSRPETLDWYVPWITPWDDEGRTDETWIHPYDDLGNYIFDSRRSM